MSDDEPVWPGFHLPSTVELHRHDLVSDLLIEGLEKIAK